MASKRKERALVALSGGVDSAVAAALLLDEGHKVEGVYVKPWDNEDDVLGDCPGGQAGHQLPSRWLMFHLCNSRPAKCRQQLWNDGPDWRPTRITGWGV